MPVFYTEVVCNTYYLQDFSSLARRATVWFTKLLGYSRMELTAVALKLLFEPLGVVLYQDG